MNTILETISYNKQYTSDIVKSKYTQKIQTERVERYKKLEDLIIYTHDVDSILEKNNKLYVDNKKLELASELSETFNNYTSFNYSKRLKKSEIQSGLQKSNTLTTILYLSDVYDISIIIYRRDKYYKMCEKKRFDVYVEYRDGWTVVLEKDIKTPGELCELNDIIDLNIDTLDVYNRFLKPISNYKIADLIEIAKQNDISIESDGKRKRKQEIYDEINIFKI